MILTFLASRLGQGFVIVSALVLALIVNNSHQRDLGAKNVLVASKEQGAKANEKSAEDRRKSDTHDAAERLRKSACRDC